MKMRLALIIIPALLASCLSFSEAQAGFFGFGEPAKGRSGLDLNGGYDVNTVATVSGRARTAPYAGEGDQVIVEVNDGSRQVKVGVGPKRYWESKGIVIRPNDEITVKGARAQGQDGQEYLLAQKLTNRSTGRQIEMRSESGQPAWSGRSGGAIGFGRSPAGHLFQGGGMMRGIGGMMRH